METAEEVMDDESIWAEDNLPNYGEWVKGRYPEGIPVIYALSDLMDLIKNHERKEKEYLVAIPYTSLGRNFASLDLMRIRMKTISWMLNAKNIRVVVMMSMDRWLDRIGLG